MRKRLFIALFTGEFLSIGAWALVTKLALNSPSRIFGILFYLGYPGFVLPMLIWGVHEAGGKWFDFVTIVTNGLCYALIILALLTFAKPRTSTR